MRDRLANAIVAAVAVAVSFAGAELAVRRLAPISDISGRYLMWSSPHFREDDVGAVRYIPNQDVRSVAVYDGTIEYDVRYHTNNLGFIDDRDYIDFPIGSPPRDRYAIVGNSFAAGIHGGSPWVPTLRADLEAARGRTEVYNLGVEGTGIQHFGDLLASFARDRPFTHIVIAAISDDFQRPRWRPLTSSHEIRFCDDDTMARCAEKAPIATIIGYHDSEAAVLEHTRQLARRPAQHPSDAGLARYAGALLRHSQFLRRVSRMVKAKSGTGKKRVQSSLAALASIREHFPTVPITFIHLPEKEEVQMNAYLMDPAPQLRHLRIVYYPALRRCQWSPAMFFARDNHPNADGYRHIEQCVLNALLGN